MKKPLIIDTIRDSINQWYTQLKTENSIIALAQLNLCLQAFFLASEREQKNEQLYITLHNLLSNGLQVEATGKSRENWQTLIHRLQTNKNLSNYADYNWYMIEMQLDLPENIETSAFLQNSSKFRAEIVNKYLVTKNIPADSLNSLKEQLLSSIAKFQATAKTLEEIIEKNNSDTPHEFQGLVDKQLFKQGYQATIYTILGLYNELAFIDKTFDPAFMMHILLEKIYYTLLYDLYMQESGNQTSIKLLVEVPRQFASIGITELPLPEKFCSFDLPDLIELAQ